MTCLKKSGLAIERLRLGHCISASEVIYVIPCARLLERLRVMVKYANVLLFSLVTPIHQFLIILRRHNCTLRRVC